jgi:hypothetical protein
MKNSLISGKWEYQIEASSLASQFNRLCADVFSQNDPISLATFFSKGAQKGLNELTFDEKSTLVLSATKITKYDDILNNAANFTGVGELLEFGCAQNVSFAEHIAKALLDTPHEKSINNAVARLYDEKMSAGFYCELSRKAPNLTALMDNCIGDALPDATQHTGLRTPSPQA